MKTADRQKTCPNCDGKIPFEVTQCPYCFTTVPVENGIQGAPFKSESLASQYAPPYQPYPSRQPGQSASSSFLGVGEEKKMFAKIQEKPQEKMESASALEEEGVLKKTFWPILLLSLAGNLFTLGVLQFFFAEEGRVILEINAGYWFLFLVVAAPLFYFGTNLLRKDSK